MGLGGGGQFGNRLLLKRGALTSPRVAFVPLFMKSTGPYKRVGLPTPRIPPPPLDPPNLQDPPRSRYMEGKNPNSYESKTFDLVVCIPFSEMCPLWFYSIVPFH